MSMHLFDSFPDLAHGGALVRKMREEDAPALLEISHSDAVYRYTPHFLYQKSETFLRTAIRNLGGRDFEKKKLIIAGVYRRDEPQRLVGLAEMFDYDEAVSMITLGYRLHERYWGRGLATDTLAAMTDYLLCDVGLNRAQAFVMPENTRSQRVLEKNGYAREGLIRQGAHWAGHGVVDLLLYARLRDDVAPTDARDSEAPPTPRR